MSDGSLVFVVPVRDPKGVKNWAQIKDILEKTLSSLHATGGAVFVAASRGSDLPQLHGAHLVEMDLPYVELPPLQTEQRYDAIRLDKGARIMHALVKCQPKGHVMVVDYDDLIHRKITDLLRKNPDAPGWILNAGYVFDSSGICYLINRGFNKVCGTSVIVRSDLLAIPKKVEDIDFQWAARMLGSHRFIQDHFANNPETRFTEVNRPLSAYRIGYGDNVSGMDTVKSTYFNSGILLKPKKLFKNLLRIRPACVLRNFS